MKSEITVTRLCVSACLIGYDLAVDSRNFLPYLFQWILENFSGKRLAILHLEGRDQKYAQKTRQKLSLHFDFFFLQLILQRFTEVTY